MSGGHVGSPFLSKGLLQRGPGSIDSTPIERKILNWRYFEWGDFPAPGMETNKFPKTVTWVEKVLIRDRAGKILI